MKATVLVDNISNCELESEWGLSVYIEDKERNILVDFGASDMFIRNAEKLGKDLKKIDYSFLSHGHYDHGNGIPAFLKINDRAKVYMSSTVEENCYGYDDDGNIIYEGIPEGTLGGFSERIVKVKGLNEIAEGLYTL
ncbi:MAG: MBL fold metallo-hydrolase, partial [Clostridia bacterium]|nr:MBL fold metallo-hydrolase [Clostridia bacterium]